MGSLYDYIDWRGDISFSEVAPCEIDNLIFSLISYVDFGDAASGELTSDSPTLLDTTKKYFRAHRGEKINMGLIVPDSIVKLTSRAARSRRFGESRVGGYVNHICANTETQFSAMTFLLDDCSIFVAFRGTDDTVVGWKENFNMSFMLPVPAQLEAVAYLENVARHARWRDIRVGGHSKGGNLAVYAGVKCKKRVKKKLRAIYNNDGPGFDRSFIDSEEYNSVRNLIRTLVPESSVVGMLLEHEESYEVVRSTASGIFQHDGMSWEVMGGSFMRAEDISDGSRRIDTILKKWLSELSGEQRRNFVDSVYEILSSGNIKTLTEMNSDRMKIFKAWGKLDAESKTLAKRFISLMLKENVFKRGKDSQREGR